MDKNLKVLTNKNQAFLYYPIYLITFYFKDVIGGIIRFFVEFNHYLISLLSISLLLRTFFKPLKNEYREGLVGFSRVAGVIVKSILLFISLIILLLVLIFEAAVISFLIFIPFSFVLLIY